MDFNRRFCYVNYKANSLWGFSFPKTFIPELPPRNHNQCLAAAMRRNPEMRVLFASGYFDLASWAGTNEYTAKNFGFPQDRTAVRVYPSGPRRLRERGGRGDVRRRCQGPARERALI